MSLSGKWNVIDIDELQYTLKISIFFQNGSGAHIIIDQTTTSNYIQISSEDVVSITCILYQNDLHIRPVLPRMDFHSDHTSLFPLYLLIQKAGNCCDAIYFLLTMRFC